MCLYSYDTIAVRAKKRIVTYKSVRKSYRNGYCHCMFISAFRSFTYEGGKLYYEPLFRREVNTGITARNLVYDGFHSHADVAEAEDECGNNYYPATTILRCEIPRGAYYYKGRSRMGEDLCSDFLIVTGWKDLYEDKWHDIPREKSRLAIRLAILKVRLRKWWYT